MNDNFNEPINSIPTPNPVDRPAMTDQEKKWAMFCHLGGFAVFILPYVVVGQIVVPLVIWLMKKQESTYIEQQGRDALNFQISITICLAIAALLSTIMIGIPILIALLIYDIVMMIKAAEAVSAGRPFHYPHCIRLI
jgi:uncharacterized Tic20 family protein